MKYYIFIKQNTTVYPQFETDLLTNTFLKFDYFHFSVSVLAWTNFHVRIEKVVAEDLG